VLEHESTSSFLLGDDFSLASNAVLHDDVKASLLGLRLEPDVSVGLFTLEAALNQPKIFRTVQALNSSRGLCHVILVSTVQEFSFEVISVALQVLLSDPLQEASFNLGGRLLKAHVFEGSDDLTHAVKLGILAISVLVNSLQKSFYQFILDLLVGVFSVDLHSLVSDKLTLVIL
jgi:hypothetical protein